MTPVLPPANQPLPPRAAKPAAKPEVSPSGRTEMPAPAAVGPSVHGIEDQQVGALRPLREVEATLLTPRPSKEATALPRPAPAKASMQGGDPAKSAHSLSPGQLTCLLPHFRAAKEDLDLANGRPTFPTIGAHPLPSAPSRHALGELGAGWILWRPETSKKPANARSAPMPAPPSAAFSANAPDASQISTACRQQAPNHA